MWLDIERTVEEIARFSSADAAQYRRLLASYDAVKGAFSRSRFTPVGMGPPLAEMLDPVWQRRDALSAWEVVRHEFESRHVQAFLLWQAFQTLVSVDLPGSGALAYSIVYGRQQRSWTLPRGGSGRLTDSLVRVIEAHGGTVVTNQLVTRLLIEGGRCAGVETADGERWLAREAVVSTIHVKHLLEMAPREVWPESFRYGVETFDAGIPAFVVYLATTAPPFTAVSAGLAGWPEDLVRACREFRDRRFVPETPWLLVATPYSGGSGPSPGGPPHRQADHAAGERAAAWLRELARRRDSYARALLTHLRRFAPDFTDDVILASLVRSPPDIEAANPHMIGGTFHGGDRGLSRSAARCGRRRAGRSTGCRSPACTRRAGRRTPAARSPAGRGATRRSWCWRTWEPASRRWCGCRTPACRPPLTTGRRGSSRPGWTTATSSGRPRGSSAGRTGSTRGPRSATSTPSGPARRRWAGGSAPPARRGCGPRVAYHFGKFVWVLDAARARAVADRAVAALARGPSAPAHGCGADRDAAPRSGNLRRPAGADRPPLVLLIPGLDSTKEEFFRLEELFLARGMATLSIDGPGQGEGATTVPIRHDYEVAVGGDARRAGRPRRRRPRPRRRARGQPRRLLRAARGRVRAAAQGGRRDQRGLRLRRACGTAAAADARDVHGQVGRTRRGGGPHGSPGACPSHGVCTGSIGRRCSSPASSTG